LVPFSLTTLSSLYPLSLHDALPIFSIDFGRLSKNVFVQSVPTVVTEDEKPFARPHRPFAARKARGHFLDAQLGEVLGGQGCRNRDRKSTRLNSSHRTISYAVFCLKK